MECLSLIEAAINDGDISQSLFKGSDDKELVIDLQRMLFELGFRKELKWDNYQADGDYGIATQAAVAAFAEKNNIGSDGQKVTNELASLMLQRHNFLPTLYTLWEIYKSDLRTRIYISKASKMSVTAIQVLLNTMGYGAQLKFAQYGADGIYGDSTRTALISYANDNDIVSDGDILTRPLVNLFVKDVNKLYGKKWSDLASKNLPCDHSPLVLFEASHFSGSACRVDHQFVPALEQINHYAEQAGVNVFVTSSFRTTTNVEGAIVTPATFSNHLVGHAIDMNLSYGDDKFANSVVLGKYPNVPDPVRQFLKSIIDDPLLRWGGVFREKDPIHIDDGLNQNMAQWKKRYQIMQTAVQLGH